MDRTSAELALSHALDDCLRTHLAVATGEDALAIRHIVMRIRLYRPPLGPFNTRFLVEHAGINGLTDSGNNSIALDSELGAGNGHRTAATAGIWLTGLGLLVLNPSNFAIF